MAWRLVKQPNGLYARFSEVVGNFTDYDMTAHEAFVLCVVEHKMPISAANKKIENADASPDRFTECLETIESVHGKEERCKMIELCAQI